MYGNLVDADASGAKASTKHHESRLEVIQGHAFWAQWKADEGLSLSISITVQEAELYSRETARQLRMSI